MMARQDSDKRPAEAGVALPVVLILMVILAVLAASGMDDSTLQERMAGNLRDRNIAFQAAESALREGEDWVQVNRAAANSNTPLTGAEATAWDGAAPAPSGTRTGLYATGDVIGLSADPVFYAGRPRLLRINPGELPVKFREIYPVIARGQGATDTSIVVLRSTFEPL